MHFSTVSDWLSWMTSIHPVAIELGLDRVQVVASRLQLLSPSCPVIIIGGTNGKGSTVAGLEAIYRAASYHVGAFTSPMLFTPNEQVRINGQSVSDTVLCLAFDAIETARGDISLTYFEFFTLAALFIFKQHSLDILLLEVGLGGRLDAVNIIDADIAIVTSIDLDHTDRLGSTRDAIATEKAGIFRTGKKAVCGDLDPPFSLLACAARLKTPLFSQGKDFFYRDTSVDWSFSYQDTFYEHLPLTSLLTQNMATVLMAITLLQSLLPITREAIDNGLSTVHLPGRLQTIKGEKTEIYDVSHNPAAVFLLAMYLQAMKKIGKTHAVFSMLSDKDITQSLMFMKPLIDHWSIATLNVPRAASEDVLLKSFHDADIKAVTVFPSIESAFKKALAQSHLGDTIVVFGSFYTVAQAWISRYNAYRQTNVSTSS